MENFKKTVGFVSLGCDKNRVDTEKIVSKLSNYSCFEFVGNKKKSQIIIVNTCAFLKASRDEASKVIREMQQLKKTAELEKLIVIGCLPLLDKLKVMKDFKGVDLCLIPTEYDQIAEKIFELYNIKNILPDVEVGCRKLTTPYHYAYLKIADGCDNMCAFCKIPKIRGHYKSVALDELINEATVLAENGVKEIILVAQDITRYGCDINSNLIELLRKLSQIKKLAWIRLLYCYPEKLSNELIDEIANNPKIVKYVDIPLQHISNNVLLLMKRRGDKKYNCNLIKTLRKRVPNIKIRSTFMVGFPGETKKDFNELCKFLKKYKLDNVGFFKYSLEEGTASYNYKNQVDEKVKDERLSIVQNLQTKIIDKKNKKFKGKILKVLCDSFDSKHKFFVARPYFSCPEIDFEVLVEYSPKVKVGNFVDVEIFDFQKGYFIARAVNNA